MHYANYSNHSLVRQQQRGISRLLADLIIEYADQHKHCGDGCNRISISRALTAGLAVEGKISAQEAERVPRIRVVISEDGTVVTMYTKHRRHRTRRSGRSGASHRRR